MEQFNLFSENGLISIMSFIDNLGASAGSVSQANGAHYAVHLNTTATYFLCLLAMVLAMICSAAVKLTFKKYDKIISRGGITAGEVARRILDSNGLYNVDVAHISGHLTDNYNPRTNVVSLSDSVINSSSLAAIGVAAHECGHAVQHATGYIPVKIRTAVVPIVNISSQAYLWVFLLGLFFSFEPLTNIGIILFAFVVIFQLITLPVEFNASRRAMSTIRDMGILQQDELHGARKTLTAAAMTYVASLVVSFTQLLRLISIKNSRR